MTRIAPTSKIVDQYGRAYSEQGPPRDPLLRHADARAIYRDIPIVSIAGDWTPRAIKEALANHKLGQFLGSSMLVDDTFGDDRVQATLGSRTGALFGQDVIHTPGKEDTDGECLAAWKGQWDDIAAQGVMSTLKRWAIMIGFGVAEILYDTSVTPWRMYLKPWHPQFIYYRWDIRRLVANTTEGPIVIEPGDGKWFVHAPFGMYRGWIHAAVRAIADKWLIKQMAWRDRARYNERHGLPIIKAKIPAAGDAVQKELFIASLSTMGQEAVVGLPQNVDETGYDLDLLEARDRAWETFRSTIEDADRSIILTIKSQNLTTEIAEGSFAAARQHGNTEQVTLEFDNSTFAHDLYEQVARPFAFFNFGSPDRAPYSCWDVQPQEDFAAKASTFQSFSTALSQMATAGVGLTPEGVSTLAKDFRISLTPDQIRTASSTSTYRIPFTPTDLAGFVTVDQALASQDLPPIGGADGALTVAQFQAKNAATLSAAANATEPDTNTNDVEEDDAQAAE